MTSAPDTPAPDTPAPETPVPEAPVPDAAAPETASAEPVIITRTLVRWVVLIGLTAFAYWHTLLAVASEIAAHTLLSYFPAALLLCGIAAIGVTVRRGPEPPIYDRQADVIVGLVLLVLATFIQVMLDARLTIVYLTAHVDLVSMWFFLLAGAVLLFGLRPAARYRWVWLLLLSMFPLPYRVLVVTFGATRLAAGIAMLILAVAATAVAVGRTRRRALSGAAAAAVLGGITLAAVHLLAPGADFGAYQWIPSLTCAGVTSAVMYVDQRRGTGSLAPLPERDVLPLTARNVRWGAAALAAFAVVVHLNGSPLAPVDTGPTIPGLRLLPPLTLPAGWHETSQTEVRSDHLYGVGSTAMRQAIRQDTGSPRYDKSSRPREVMVDTLVTRTPLTLDVYPTFVNYDIDDDRTGDPTQVHLPHGVTGTLQTTVDDTRNLTFERLTWRWNNGADTAQVTLFTVDDHRPGAVFPLVTRPSQTWQLLNSLLTITLRGKAVTEHQTREFKDYELLTGLATGLIDTQVDLAERSAA